MIRRWQLFGLAVLSLMLGAGCNQMKVNPGEVGILINYQDGSVKEVKPGIFWWNFNGYERLVTYPVTQQTLVMVQTSNEGKVTGDDSIPCRDDTNNQVQWDVALTWRVNPDKASELYYLKRELPLDDPKSDNDITSQVVRQSARSRLREVCPLFKYTTMETHRAAISDQYKELVKADLAQSFLILDDVYLRDLHLSKEQNDAIIAFIAGNNALAQAEFARQKAMKDAETTKVNYEIAQQQKTYEVDQDNLRKVNTAKADALVVTARMQAEADGNKALAPSITPGLSEYVRAQHWDGKGPTTVLGPGSQSLVQVP